MVKAKDVKVLGELLEPLRAFTRKHKLNAKIVIDFTDPKTGQGRFIFEAFEPPMEPTPELKNLIDSGTGKLVNDPENLLTLRKVSES